MKLEHVSYQEDLLAHQEPVFPVSEWQSDNDLDGVLARAAAEAEERAVALDRCFEGMPSPSSPGGQELMDEALRLVFADPLPHA